MSLEIPYEKVVIKRTKVRQLTDESAMSRDRTVGQPAEALTPAGVVVASIPAGQQAVCSQPG